MNKRFAATLLFTSLIALAGCEGDDGSPGAAGATGAAGPAGPAGPAGTNGSSTSVDIVADTVTTDANDMRGLTFAQVGDNANKIYVSGHVGITDDTRQVVVGRFFADGSLDTSFGGDGFVELEATATEGSSDENSYGVAELLNGDVVAVVNALDADGGRSVYMFRLAPDGTQVPGWGDADGKVEVVFGYANADNATFPGAPAALPSDLAWDVQTDRSVMTDRVVVFGQGSASDGTRTDRDRYVARLDVTATGATTDPTFNSGSAFTYNATGVLNDNNRRGLVEADGKIVSSGYTDLGGALDNHIFLIRLSADGTLDADFGGFSDEPTITATPGIAVFNPFKVDLGYAEAYAAGFQQSTQSYVVVGYGATTNDTTPSTLGYETSLAQDVVLFRVSSGVSAGIDTGFGNVGTQAVQSEGRGFPTNEDRGRHIVTLPDDRAVVAGRIGGNPAAFVFTVDGQLDDRVLGDGIVELPNETVNSQFFGLAVSPEGNRVALTTNTNDNGARLVIMKL
ncbi:MAG: hypothetical protein AAF917_15430, partial [Pseudomonadota bacterium]